MRNECTGSFSRLLTYLRAHRGASPTSLIHNSSEMESKKMRRGALMEPTLPSKKTGPLSVIIASQPTLVSHGSSEAVCAATAWSHTS